MSVFSALLHHFDPRSEGDGQAKCTISIWRMECRLGEEAQVDFGLGRRLTIVRSW